MEIWSMWVTLIENSMLFASSYFGVSEAIAIIAVTLLARIMLLPISYKSAYKMYTNKLAMKALKPELDQLNSKFKNDPVQLAEVTMSLYKEKGIRLLDKTTVLSMGAQGILGVGIFQALKEMLFNSKFLWIPDLAKPDIILAVLLAVITFLMMTLMPGAAEQSVWLMLAVPVIISVVVYFTLPAAIGIYLIASNVVTLCQSIFLQYVISKQNRKLETY